MVELPKEENTLKYIVNDSIRGQLDYTFEGAE